MLELLPDYLTEGASLGSWQGSLPVVTRPAVGDLNGVLSIGGRAAWAMACTLEVRSSSASSGTIQVVANHSPAFTGWLGCMCGNAD